MTEQPIQSPDRRASICILSRKNLERVTRVVRMAKALNDSGYDVTVVSLGRPCRELAETTPEVEYIEVALDPWTRRMLLAVRKATVWWANRKSLLARGWRKRLQQLTKKYPKLRRFTGAPVSPQKGGRSLGLKWSRQRGGPTIEGPAIAETCHWRASALLTVCASACLSGGKACEQVP